MGTEFTVGVDIGGNNFRIGAVAKDGEVLCSAKESSRAFAAESDPVRVLGDKIEAVKSEVDGELRGVCIGFPGTVTKDKTTPINCINMPALDGVNVAAALIERFGVKAIIEHEVLLLLTNDLQRFKLFDKDCVMAVYVGTGLGNAMYIHGRLLEGKNGNSGELGHIPMPHIKEYCPCGNMGCVELMASGKFLEKLHDELYGQYDSFDDMFRERANDEPLDEFVRSLAVPIATEITILDPDVVLLGGGVIDIPHFPYERLLEQIVFRTRKPFPANNLEIVRVPNDPLQGIRGAGIYCWQRL